MLNDEQEEALRYLFQHYTVNPSSMNHSVVQVDTFIGLLKEKLDGNN